MVSYIIQLSTEHIDAKNYCNESNVYLPKDDELSFDLEGDDIRSKIIADILKYHLSKISVLFKQEDNESITYIGNKQMVIDILSEGIKNVSNEIKSSKMHDLVSLDNYMTDPLGNYLRFVFNSPILSTYIPCNSNEFLAYLMTLKPNTKLYFGGIVYYKF